MFTICLTHDVEMIYHPYKKINFLYSLLKSGCISGHINYIKGKKSALLNPYDTIERIKKIETRYHARSTFFFLNKGYGGSDYHFSDTRIKEMINNLHLEGWEVALHGTFASYNSLPILKIEKTELEQESHTKVIGIRQHGLRLEIPRTFAFQKACGFSYDSSYFPPKYAEKRCFKPFCAVDGLLEIPLVMMDSDWEYMTHDKYHGCIENVWNRIKKILTEGKVRDGVCTILWHPHAFYTDGCECHKNMYSHFKGFGEVGPDDPPIRRRTWGTHVFLQNRLSRLEKFVRG